MKKEIFSPLKKRMLANIISFLSGKVTEELFFDDAFKVEFAMIK
ncbi:hypothetical protein [Candidatus Phytoplasma solani]